MLTIWACGVLWGASGLGHASSKAGIIISIARVTIAVWITHPHPSVDNFINTPRIATFAVASTFLIPLLMRRASRIMASLPKSFASGGVLWGASGLGHASSKAGIIISIARVTIAVWITLPIPFDLFINTPRIATFAVASTFLIPLLSHTRQASRIIA